MNKLEGSLEKRLDPEWFKNKGFMKLTDEEYFNHDGVSNSFLKRFTISPAHAFTLMPESNSMNFGTMLHDFVLQNDLFHDKYFVTDLDMRTKAGKDMKESNPEKTFISNKDLCELIAIREMIWSKSFNGRSMNDIIDVASKEISVFWDREGVQCKAKLDLYYNDLGINYIFDLKTCQDARPEKFKWDVINYGYDRQASWYRDGVLKNSENPCEFIFIAIEKQAPYGVKFHKLLDYTIADLKNDETFQNYLDWKLFGENYNQCYDNEISILEV